MNFEKHIMTVFNDGEKRNIGLTSVPDRCPFCHNAIDPIILFAYCNKTQWDQDNCLQVIYKCTVKSCDNLFIAYYKSFGGNCTQFVLRNIKPTQQKTKKFSETIQLVSPDFCLIYGQAFIAEKSELKEISGVGYRKALEFLIKDYLIKQLPDKSESIKAKLLAKCIEDHVANSNIKEMAKRATWLGNDETHYVRRWENKDVEDMKRIIDVTLYWIEMEKLTQDTITEMPEKTTTTG